MLFKPIVYAFLGTSGISSNSREFAEIVLSVRFTVWVVLSHDVFGSLKAIVRYYLNPITVYLSDTRLILHRTFRTRLARLAPHRIYYYPSRFLAKLVVVFCYYYIQDFI